MNEGHVLSVEDELMNEWENYMTDLFKGHREPLPFLSSYTGTSVLKAEVENGTSHKPQGCGPGLLLNDNIGELTALFNQIHDVSEIPLEWLKSFFIPLKDT